MKKLIKNTKKMTALVLILVVFISSGCSAKETATKTANKVKDTAVSVKDAVANWYSNLDMSKFKDGWDHAIDFMGAQYAAAVSSQYVQEVSTQIVALKDSINAAAGSARGVAQEAGYAAERWAAGTFNIDAAARGSKESAKAIGSNELASPDVVMSYGEEASLKYYKTAKGSAVAQAKKLMDAYNKYAYKTDNPMSVKEWMDQKGYNANEMGELLKSQYEGQTRIIPSDQLPDAVKYLENKIAELPAGESVAYKETLDKLKDHIEAPDGTKSIPLTQKDAQIIAEMGQDGTFDPAKFNITLSQMITPKYVLKQSMGAGVEVAMIKTVFEVGPDVFSIIGEAVKSGELDGERLEEVGIEARIAFGSGFAEGSISNLVVTLCHAGILGDQFTNVEPSVVAALTVLMIEAAIDGYALSRGEITPEDYGNLMADRIMITALALPTIALVKQFICPAPKLVIMAGCMAGSIVACAGYYIAKDIVLDFIDGGGFEAIVPVDMVKNSVSILSEKVGELNIKDKVSNFKDMVLSTANNGYITIRAAIGKT